MSRDHSERLKQKHPDLEFEITDQFIKVKDPQLKIEMTAPSPKDGERAKKEAERLAKRMPCK